MTEVSRGEKCDIQITRKYIKRVILGLSSNCLRPFLQHALQDLAQSHFLPITASRSSVKGTATLRCPAKRRTDATSAGPRKPLVKKQSEKKDLSLEVCVRGVLI